MTLHPEVQCDECHCQGAYVFDGKSLCETCYATLGACCAGETEPD